MISKIISGGQTGADMGGLLAAELFGIPRGGSCPEGFKDENGFNSEFIPRFGLVECGDIKERTISNIKNSDATIIFSKNLESGGTKFTISQCELYKKPYYIVKTLKGLNHFILNFNGVLNVAGNRESVSPGIQNRVRDFLSIVIMPQNGVFVFGSNSDGIHGAGAAKMAKDYFGAKNGIASGLMGRSYAIVTKKDFKTKKSSSIEEIEDEVNKFYEFAKEHKELKFFVTEIGCGLAGYNYTEIAPLFKKFFCLEVTNVCLPVRFNESYPANKMMLNSKYTGNYHTLNKMESASARKYFANTFIDKYGIGLNDKFDVFLDDKNKLCSSIERVVVGDHGPYIEFKPENLLVKTECMKGKEFKHTDRYSEHIKYFDENPVGFPGVLLYNQQRTVTYADYKAGMYYVSPDDVIIKKLPNENCKFDRMEVSQITEQKVNKSPNRGDFVHLHVHSSFSLLDGICEFPDLFARMKEINQDTIALTDHGYLYGNYKFQKAAEEAGIKPIHGVEAYFANDALDMEQKKNYHLILLCMNEAGWKNLCYMMTMANRDRFYKKPRIDEVLLKEHNEGLICLSACYASPVTFHLMEEGFDPDRAKNNAMFLKGIFGDRFYNEAMFTSFESYNKYYPRVLELAHDIGIKTVASNDVHFVRKEDAELQDVLTRINTHGKMSTSDNSSYFLKSREEMITHYITPEMCDTTLEIADRCNFQLKFSGYLFPKFQPETKSDYKEFLEWQKNK